MDRLDHLSVSTCLGSWAGSSGQQAFCQPLSHMRCCKLLTTSANEPHHVIEKPIKYRMQLQKNNNRKKKFVTDFTDILEKKTLSICRVGTMRAHSLLHPNCVPALTLMSSGSGDGNLCTELWQYSWMPGRGFCQYSAGASSCFSVAVKHTSTTDSHSPPGVD